MKYLNKETVPLYTKDEISNMVEGKLNNSHLTKKEFANKNKIDLKILNQILEAQVSFSKDILQVCCNILNKNISELVPINTDNIVSIECKNINDNTVQTLNVANALFCEIITQDKINN